MLRRHLPAIGVAITVPSVLVAQLVACGGGGGGHIMLHDSPAGGGDINTNGNCTATASYGSPTLSTATADAEYLGSGSSQDTGFLEYYLNGLNTDSTPDLLEIDLYSGYGAFESGTGLVRTGTYTLGTGGETMFSTCGACVVIDTDLSSQNVVTDFYFATGGTLTLTSVGTSSLAGSLSNVTFAHVDAGSDSTGSPIPGDTIAADGCQSAITAASFTATPTMQPSNIAPQTVDGIPVRVHLHDRK